MFMGISFFKLGKFSSTILLKIFTWPLIWESSLSPIPSIFRFHLFIVSWISWMFWVRSFLFWAFSLTVVSLFSVIIFCTWDSLFYLLYSVSDACMYDSRFLFKVFYLQICLLCDVLIISTSIFISWMVLFTSFICLCFHVFLYVTYLSPS